MHLSFSKRIGAQKSEFDLKLYKKGGQQRGHSSVNDSIDLFIDINREWLVLPY